MRASRLQQLQPWRVADCQSLAVQVIFSASAKPTAITAADSLLPGNPDGSGGALTALIVKLVRLCNDPKFRADTVHGGRPAFAEFPVFDGLLTTLARCQSGISANFGNFLRRACIRRFPGGRPGRGRRCVPVESAQSVVCSSDIHAFEARNVRSAGLLPGAGVPFGEPPQYRRGMLDVPLQRS